MTDKVICVGVSVSRETSDALDLYAERLRKWNKAINLVAPSTVPALWERHFVDSAQLYPLIPQSAQTLCDLGSGAGFPGLIIAILAKETRPDLAITLIESDKRKATFLREIARETDCNATISATRIEAYTGKADVISARAVANLTQLFMLSAPILEESGVALFPKGAQAQGEIDEARRMWDFDVVKHQSCVDDAASILEIRQLSSKVGPL